MDSSIIAEFFSRYNATSNFNIISPPQQSVSTMSGQQFFVTIGGPVMEAHLVFSSPADVERLSNDIALIKEFNTEARIRKSNPTIMRAYEDYKILLKLQGVDA